MAKKFLKVGKSGLKETREGGFVKKDGMEIHVPPVYDRVRRVLSPIVFPTLPNVWCPYMWVPYGIECRVIKGTGKLEEPKKESKPRFLHVAADHSGCGWWRLHELEDISNYGNHGRILNMDLAPAIEYFIIANRFDAIKMQRQLGDRVYMLWKAIANGLKEQGCKTRLIYELDDVIAAGYIPDYNESKKSFERPEIQKSLHDMLDLVDELFVCSEKMRSVYRKFHQSVDISVVPNFSSKGWFDGFYDLEKRMRWYDRNRRRPRGLISGGATHTSAMSRMVRDRTDYSKVVDAIISARKDFEFVIFGVQPNVFRAFIETGEMKFVPWVSMQNYPATLDSLNVQCSIAPLDDNDFNRAKSSIKWQESCYMGFGFAGQDIDPYAEARHRFHDGDELISMLKDMTKDDQTFQEEIEYNRLQADKYWIDDKIDDILTLYKTPYGSKEREAIKWFVDLNPAQFHAQKKK